MKKNTAMKRSFTTLIRVVLFLALPMFAGSKIAVNPQNPTVSIMGHS
jgi:hypothetical protein